MMYLLDSLLKKANIGVSQLVYNPVVRVEGEAFIYEPFCELYGDPLAEHLVCAMCFGQWSLLQLQLPIFDQICI